jgi:hypothetical protein
MGVQRSKAASRHTHPANTLPGAIGGWSEPRIWMKRSIPQGAAGHKGAIRNAGVGGRSRQIGILMGSGFLDLFPSAIAHF